MISALATSDQLGAEVLQFKSYTMILFLQNIHQTDQFCSYIDIHGYDKYTVCILCKSRNIIK